MSIPFYKDAALAARTTTPSINANMGLWFTRFYNGFDDAWEVPNNSKIDWIKTVSKKPSGDAAQLENLLERQKKLSQALGGITAELETTSPLATGLGLNHPVENGFTFHHTYGMPYLPASGIKGVLRAWVEVWMDHANEEIKNACIARWFGTAKGNLQKLPESAGNLLFFDALPTKPVNLDCDIMTPHMGGWYEKGGDSQHSAKTIPADWHSPVPIPFLVVKSGTTFCFTLAPRLTGNVAADTQTKIDLSEAMQELQKALEWMGAGAKTATGYGRLVDRVAEKIAESSANLEAAGIKSGQERWEEVKLDWNKGSQTLTATNMKPAVGDKHKSVLLTNPTGKTEYNKLSESARKRLDKGKAVMAKAIVSIQGNKVSLDSLEEIP